ncbi:MAG: hypothetical protein GYB23_03540 [Vibrionaceae bacterium]|nr:hypothetical protein [Vibrionaceae bacterium]
MREQTVQLPEEPTAASEKTEQDILDKLREKTPNQLLAFIAIIIAAGQFNDAIDMTSKGWDLLVSNFSDAPSNDRLSNVYIRAPSGILEESFGSPVYTKFSNGEVEIKYFKDKKFILSAITSNDTIDAFLVFPKQGFVPEIRAHAGGENYLKTTFADSTTLLEATSNLARSGNYYIEEAQGGRYELLYNSIGGYSEYLSNLNKSQVQLLATFNDKFMMEEDTSSALINLRQQIKPNFYGYSAVGLEDLTPAILTKLEYELITD